MRTILIVAVAALMVGCGSDGTGLRASDAGAGGSGGPGTAGLVGSGGGSATGSGGSTTGATPTYQNKAICPPCTHASDAPPNTVGGVMSCRAGGSRALDTAVGDDGEFLVRDCVMVDGEGRQIAICGVAGAYVPACWVKQASGCPAVPTGTDSFSTIPRPPCPGSAVPGASWSDGVTRACLPTKPNDEYHANPPECATPSPLPPAPLVITGDYVVSCWGDDDVRFAGSLDWGKIYRIVDDCTQHGCRTSGYYCR